MTEDQKNGLSKGLQELLMATMGEQNHFAVFNEEPTTEHLDSGVLKAVKISAIMPCSFQPRKRFDPIALEELAQSIREQGIIQPLVVRKHATLEGEYELIAGERRLRAAELAGLQEVPVVIKAMTDKKVVAVALIENLQRENLNPIEQARGLLRLINEFGYTHETVGNVIGKSRSSITNLLRILDLHSDVQKMLELNDLDMGHARALLGLPLSEQREAAREIIAKHFSVRQAEAYVRAKKNSAVAVSSKADLPGKDVNASAMEQALIERFGTKVELQAKRGNKGKLIIHYADLSILDSILEKLDILLES